MDMTFRNEGGFRPRELADQQGDRGGATNMGITEVTLRRLGIEKRVEDLTRREAVAIYRQHYWNPLAARYESSTPWLAVALFDATVQHGGPNAIRLLQRTAGGIDVDGSFGPNTLAAVREAVFNLGAVRFLIAYHGNRLHFIGRYVAREPWKRAGDLVGMIDRVYHVLDVCVRLSQQAEPFGVPPGPSNEVVSKGGETRPKA